jgi:predicted nucleotidyltransferase
MPETMISELLGKLRRGLEHLYGERLAGVYLFGSFARAEESPASDVDILVVLDEVTDYGQEIERTGHLVSGLSLDYDVSISRVFVSLPHGGIAIARSSRTSASRPGPHEGGYPPASGASAHVSRCSPRIPRQGRSAFVSLLLSS